MPTPIELTAILLAGSISIGSYESKLRCPEIEDIEKELLIVTLESKYRNIIVKGYDDFERAYFDWQVSRKI